MGKKAKKNKARTPHASSKEEVIQLMEERKAAQEERLTLDEAREILAKKEELLAQAQEERGRILLEVDAKKAELSELDAVYEAKKETLLLNEEAQKIIAQREQTLSDASKEAAKVVSDARAKAENDAQELLERARQEAIVSAASKAEAIVSTARTRAADEAKEIIAAAKAEEQAMIVSGEQTAALRAEAILSRAEEDAKRVRSNAERYEQQSMDAVRKRVEEIESDASSRFQKTKDELLRCGQALDQRASQLAERETLLLLEAEEKAEALTAAKKEALDKLEAALAKKKADLDKRELTLTEQKAAREEQANRTADEIVSRAEEHEKNVYLRAEQYEQQRMDAAHKKAEALLSAASSQLQTAEDALLLRSQALDQKERQLAEREALLPQEAEEKAAALAAAKKEALDKREAALAEKEAELDDLDGRLKYQERRLAEAERLFDERVEQGILSRHTDLKNKYEQMRKTADALRDTNNDLCDRLADVRRKADKRMSKDERQALESERLLREEAEEKCNKLQEALNTFRENGITRDNIREITAQKAYIQDLELTVDSLRDELNKAKHQAALNTGAALERDTEKQNVSYLKQTIAELTEELELRKAVSREDMLRPIIKAPPLVFHDTRPPKDPDELAGELEWLKHIQTQSKKSGIHFHDRQLMAYHTSLKIGEWSPLVVLSGVSGTGKSELPKQYAIHGGMRFLSIPVKPDWDSPASLFGYYNSIENKFEATELIRALYQMQSGKKTPWSDGMLMVLLDEMNLAHPEQYFADLLSKFEESRNSDSVPCCEIALGAGEPPEKLSIGRNVLWTGTMNEDETTKGLSDKVIDRSMLITFPCPKELYSRSTNKIEKPQLTLTYKRWESWKNSALHSEDAGIKDMIDVRKKTVEQINHEMTEMGRNLGHRVWQSIQNYILNYPLVIAAKNDSERGDAVQKAFCDALAFKMMPKLRGLEVKGPNEDHLDSIGKHLNDMAAELSTDFDKARGMTSEIFQWNSAEFMERSE